MARRRRRGPAPDRSGSGKTQTSAGTRAAQGDPRSLLRHLPLAFALLAIAVALAHLRTQIDSNDEGIATMGAWHVLRGEAPYRDFFAVETPLSFYVVAPLYALFGAKFLVGRIVAQVLGVAMVVSVFRLAGRWIPAPLFAAVPVAFLCQAGVGVWPFASHHWFVNVFCFGALLAASRALLDGWTIGWWLAGVASALALASLQDQGAMVSIGLAIVAAFASPPGTRLRAFARFGGGLLLVGIPAVLYILRHSGLAASWYDLIRFPLTSYRGVPGNNLGFLQPFREVLEQWTSGAWRHAPVFTASTTISCVALIVVPLAAPLLILWGWKRLKGPAPVAALLLAGTLAFALSAIRRWAPINLQWAAAPPALALGWWLHQKHEASPGGRRWTTAAACLLLTAFALFGAGRIEQAASGAIWFDVDSPAGRTRVPDRRTGQEVQEMIRAIGERVPVSAPLVVYGWPTWGFAAGHPSPLHWDVFAPPGYPPGSLADEAIAEVERKKIDWIATPAFDLPEEGRDGWQTYLLAHYRLEWSNPGWGLWKRSEGGMKELMGRAPIMGRPGPR